MSKVAWAGALEQSWFMPGFDQELTELKQKLLTMASHAESSVHKAVEALDQRDYDLAARVQEDDGIIDRFEVEVDDLAIRLLGKGPQAEELRLITVAMKVSQNLERVGDETTTIARRAQELCQEVPLKVSLDIPRMAGLTVRMLKGALDAFVNENPAAARGIIPQDKEVDVWNKENHRRLAEQMIQDPESVTRCLSLMVISKSLERIADHAKNVAEEVVYLCEARDIRHSGSPEAAAGGPGDVTNP
jgi:phosphate transport system protein